MEKRKSVMHAIISGIDKLANDTEAQLASISTISYESIHSKNELNTALQNCDIFWFRLNHRITSDVLKNATCKYILCAVTGLDHIDLEACAKNNIQVISLKGETEFLKEVRATAEHTVGLLLALIRRSKRAFQHSEEGKWNRYLFQGTELYKKHIGVLGLGRLGTIVAQYYSAFGMKVYYYDIVDKEADSSWIKTNSMEELCKSIDILSIHLPYDESTYKIVDSEIMSHLKHSAVIVNTARGGVVNESDLLKLLQEEKIAGYATDVLSGEPEVKNHPLVTYAKNNENVIITPHIAGNTYESIEKTEAFVLNKLMQKLNS